MPFVKPMSLPLPLDSHDDELTAQQQQQQQSSSSSCGKEKSNVMKVNVTAAPCLGGVAMYEVRVSYHGQKKRSMKTKQEFRDISQLCQLLEKTSQCTICSMCTLHSKHLDQRQNVISPYRTFQATSNHQTVEDYSRFLQNLIGKLRCCAVEDVVKCSHHMGVVRILMEFLGVQDGACFCPNGTDATMVSCSLSRSLSKQFAALDSVC